MKLSNKEILFYTSVLFMLMYIWYNAQIDIKYLFPFILFAIYFYNKEEIKNTTNENNNNRVQEIIDELYDEEYKYLNTDEIVLFIDTLRPIRQFNIPIFNNFLLYLNEFFKVGKMTHLLAACDIFESIYFAMPPEMTDFFTVKNKELQTLMYNNLKEDKHDRVEMQSYLPSSYIHNNLII